MSRPFTHNLHNNRSSFSAFPSGRHVEYSEAALECNERMTLAYAAMIQEEVEAEATKQILERRNTNRMTTVIERLMTCNIDAVSMDAMIQLSAECRALEAEYKELKAAVPDILLSGVKTLRKAIESRLRDKMAADLKSLESQFEAMQSAETKRARVAEQIAALRAQLEGK
jgi:hypothetical protein